MSEVFDLDAKIVIINGISLLVERTGTIHRYLKNGDLKLIKNIDTCKGYNKICCNGKFFFRHRIIASAYIGLDIDNPTLLIDHINHDRLNNSVDNLRIVSNQQNQFNRNAKGYSWNKATQTYQARINAGGKRLCLGYFDKPEDAHSAYLRAKAIHHII